MTFKVKARVLLELGAELISSDGIALYELIKNSVDAGSESVEIRVNIGLTPSGHRVLQTQLAALPPRTRLRRDWLEEAAKRYFEATASVDLREKFVNLLEGSLPAVAIPEAEAFYREFTYIEVEDWGCGMTMEDLRTKFLTIGTPNRAQERARLGATARLLGEKGIGRLSAMRLGLTTEVVTGTKSDGHWSKLNVDWSKLRADPDLELEEFEVEPERGDVKTRGLDEGTLLRISDLQADWSMRRLASLARAEFSKLQDPFDTEGSVLELSLWQR